MISSSPALSRIGALWQQRVAAQREYEVVRDGNVFGTSISNNVVFSSLYEQARHELSLLLARYQGKAFDAIFNGEEMFNEAGVCFALESRNVLAHTALDPDRFRTEVLHDLTLVHGIGQTTQERLKARGYQTVIDLLRHPKFRQNAHKVTACASGSNAREIMGLISARHPKSHPYVLGTAALHEPGDYIFLDIETLGLFSRPIILFGIGCIENGSLVVHQYLLRNIEEEPAALLATCDHFTGDNPALITFNGKSFDLPYLQERLAYYGMGCPACISHFDVLHFSRRKWKDQLPSLRLSALERDVLGIYREDDIPGQMVPEFYETYQHTGNCGPLVPIVEHNKQDVLSLAHLFFHLLGESYGRR